MELGPEERIEKQRRFIIRFIYWGILIALIAVVLKLTWGVLAPFVVAFIVAWILQKPICFTAEKSHIPKPAVALFFVIMFYLLAGTILGVCGTRLLAAWKEFFSGVPEIFSQVILPMGQRVEDWLNALSSSLDTESVAVLENSLGLIGEQAMNFISSLSGGAISGISGVLTGVPGAFMKILISIIASAFITIDFNTIKDFLSRQLPPKIKDVITEGKDYAGGTLIKCLKSYILIILMTFTELMIGLSILRIPQAATLSAIIAIVDILPILGTGTILIPWALASMILGNIPLGIGIAVIYIVVLVVRNIVEPKLIGKQVGLHPIATLLSMLLGLNLCGLIGMFGFPITLSLIQNLNKRGVIHIFK